MKLNEEDINALVSIRLQRAKETIAEVSVNVQFGFWRVVAQKFIQDIEKLINV